VSQEVNISNNTWVNKHKSHIRSMEEVNPVLFCFDTIQKEEIKIKKASE
jgi:hypothetical protein